MNKRTLLFILILCCGLLDIVAQTTHVIHKTTGELITVPEYEEGDILRIVGDELENYHLYDYEILSKLTKEFQLDLANNQTVLPNFYLEKMISISAPYIEHANERWLNKELKWMSFPRLRYSDRMITDFLSVESAFFPNLEKLGDVFAYYYLGSYYSLPKLKTMGRGFSAASMTELYLPKVETTCPDFCVGGDGPSYAHLSNLKRGRANFFAGNRSLKSMYLPQVKELERSAFSDSRLESLFLPKIERILGPDASVEVQSNSLRLVYWETKNPTIGANSIIGKCSNPILLLTPHANEADLEAMNFPKGSKALKVNRINPFVIRLQPGEELDITVDIPGIANLQWYKDGKPIVGATSFSYEKALVTAEDAGLYSLFFTYDINNNLVINSYEQYTLAETKVIVGSKPTISGVSSLNVLTGETITPVEFTFSGLDSLRCAGFLPQGMLFDKQTGVLSGTPTIAGEYVLWFHGDNDYSRHAGEPALHEFIIHVFENEIPVQYAIEASAGEGGRITPEGKRLKLSGADQTFTFLPDEAYVVDRVLVDGVNNIDAVLAGTYTFRDITEDHTIAVSYKKKTSAPDSELNIQQTHVITKENGEPLNIPAYNENDVLRVVGDALEGNYSSDYDALLNLPKRYQLDLSTDQATLIALTSDNLFAIYAPYIETVSDHLSVGYDMKWISLPRLRKAYMGSAPYTSLEYVFLPQLEELGDYSFFFYWQPVFSLPKVKSIGQLAFDTSTTSEFYFPNAETLKYGFLKNNENLSYIYLPKANYIGESSFNANTSLISIYLPNAKVLDKLAFAGSRLESLFVPKIEEIVGATEESPFGENPLRLVYWETKTPTVSANSIIGKSLNPILLLTPYADEADLGAMNFPEHSKALRTNRINPVDIFLSPGDELNISVDIEGISNLQWLKDGEPIPGANGLSYIKASVLREDVGLYALSFTYDINGNDVIEEYEQYTLAGTKVIVGSAPTISGPSSIEVPMGRAITPIQLEFAELERVRCAGILPQGMSFDEETGVLSGVPSVMGQYDIWFHGDNDYSLHKGEPALYELIIRVVEPIIPVEYTIEAAASEGGSISPSGDITLLYEEEQTFYFEPDEGYHISRVLIDGVNNLQAVENAYYLLKATDNHTIFVSFEPDPEPPSSKLQTLSVTNGRMVPEFSTEITDYTVYLDCGASSSELHYTTESESAEVFVLEELVFQQPGSHSVVVQVIDGEEEDCYNLNFIRPFDQVVIPVWENVLSVINNLEHNGGYTFVAYQWYRDNEMKLPMAGETSGNLYLENDKNTNPDYTVWLTTSDDVSACGCRVDAEASLRSIRVYPNPMKEKLTVESVEKENTRIEICDLQGKRIKVFTIDSAVSTVDVSDIMPGVYVVRVGEKSFLIIKDK